MDTEAWCAAVHEVTKSWTWLSNWTELDWATELDWTEHIRYVFVAFWLSSLSMIISGSIHVAADGIILFIFMAESCFTVDMYHLFFIHSSVNGHLGCFHVLTIVNCAAVNIGVHVFFVVVPGVGLGYTIFWRWESWPWKWTYYHK